MKPMSITAPINVQLSAQDRFGRQLAACLDTSARELPHDISERLRVARLQAMDRYRPARPVVLTPAVLVQSANGGAAVLGGGDAEHSLWPRLVALVPLLALIAGLIMLQIQGSDSFAEETASIDTAILTDDLPPDAYSDPGFAQFLKTRLSQAPKQERQE